MLNQNLKVSEWHGSELPTRMSAFVPKPAGGDPIGGFAFLR